MDTARYVLAIVALLAYPCLTLFWLLVHPFVGFWRRLGPTATYLGTLSILAMVGLVLYRTRDTLLAVEYGTSGIAIAAALALYVVGVRIERQVRRELPLRTLIGLPELRREADGRLLQDGIFSRVRHPRYYGAAYGVLATALLTNYLAIYLVAVAYVPAIYLVTVFEERELIARFGDAYRAYRRRVPRLVPWRRLPPQAA